VASNGREVELKYAVEDSDAVRELVATDTVGGLRAGPWRTQMITDRYIDTAGRDLARAGLGARLRQLDQQTLITVKSDRRDGGAEAGTTPSALHDRVELEADANQKLDPGQWPASGARSIVEDTIGDARLRTTFTIVQNRAERDLIDRDGVVVATLSVDDAQVRRLGRERGSFTTLEVEASDAAAGAVVLQTVADALEASGLLRPEPRSKQQIALELIGTSATAPRPPRTPGITADDPLAEAGRKVLRQHLLRMLVAEAGVRGGDDAESVHKMRVATRRMRAAWRVFDGAYEPELQASYIRQLRVVATALGAVRDLDVQIERLDGYIETLNSAGAREQLAPLASEWRWRRDAAQRDLLRLFDKRAYEKFVDDYRAFVETAGAGVVGEPSRVRDVAAGRVWRAYERLRIHDSSLPQADAAALHQVRIDGKRLRYTIEFFREVLPPAVDSLVAELTAQQDHLGLFNDAQVAVSMTRDWLQAAGDSVPAETRRAASAYVAASERDQLRVRRSFTRLWRRVVGRTFRRRLAVAVSEL
jgi:CHAD domain-containing protein